MFEGIKNLYRRYKSIDEERRKEIILVVGFIVSLPLIWAHPKDKIAKALFTCCLMAIYWY